jgi:colanic acid/amylovoran biosynthesis glycosyltransferase
MSKPASMRIGYLMNSYPMTSTTFIRGEIEALEEMNVEIKRYAIRHWDQKLVDPKDIAESARTEYLLSGNAARLIVQLFTEICTNLFGLMRTLGPWLAQLRHSDGSLVKHVAYLMEAIRLRRLTKRDRIPHLHVHFSTNSAAVAMLTKLLGGPSYSFTAHGPDEFHDRSSGGLYLKIKHADFVVAISNFCKVQLVSHSAMDFWNRIHIVRCGIQFDELAASAELFDGNQTLVCVGRLCVQKGQLLLPAAAALLRADFPGLKIVLIGDGPIRAQLEQLIAQHGVGEVIELRGWQSNVEVRATMLKSRALLLPSFAEGLPVVIMEALALGRPVISTYIAGIPELVDPGCGWLVPSGSEPELATAIRLALVADVPHLRELGLEGRRRVARNHDIRTNAGQLRELLTATLAARPS